MVDLNSSVTTQPWNLSVVSDNGTDQLRNLVAPAWVGSPNVRGSMDILQSCLLTLVACIYTALHLDVPRRTTGQFLLMQKTKYVLITLFAPELSVYMAMLQLRHAWNLRSALRHVLLSRYETIEFEIDLKYAFFIVMGAVRFDVHDILSIPDLDLTAAKYFEDLGPRRKSVRPGPALIIWFAKRGHWIKIRKQDIDDKSKADTLQKALVLIQVAWMVIQCIARRISDLPLTLLEIHTMVHVVCAMILYACWFQKPLDVQEPIVVNTEGFESEIATQLQKEFYTNMAYKMVLFPAKQQDSQTPPTDVDGEPMHWIIPKPQTDMKVGDVLPSGLALYTRNQIRYENTQFIPDSNFDSNSSLEITGEFLRRWASILIMHPFEERETLAKSSRKLIRDPAAQHFPIWNSHFPEDYIQPLYLARLKELQPGPSTDWNRPFWEGKSIVHLDRIKHWESRGVEPRGDMTETHDFTLDSPLVAFIALLLTGVYGGVHMAAWRWTFPSYPEEIMWKLSCFIIISTVPNLIFIYFLVKLLGKADDSMGMWKWKKRFHRLSWFRLDLLYIPFVFLLVPLLALEYLFARTFIIVESFISLRRAVVGVFVSPEWIELFPHF